MYKNRLFRKGIHSDYIHNTTNNDYYPLEHYKETKPNVITEIDEFMYQLFPETELREYMWEHLASTIIGTNQNQTFNIYLGVGANGKSKLVELMGKSIGRLQRNRSEHAYHAKKNKHWGHVVRSTSTYRQAIRGDARIEQRRHHQRRDYERNYRW